MPATTITASIRFERRHPLEDTMDAGDAHVRDPLDREAERLRGRGGLLRDRQVRRAGRDDRHGPPTRGCGSEHEQVRRLVVPGIGERHR